jgi:hypothetical protein
VVGQGLGAGPADPAAVLLQTPQNHLVAVIHLGAAKPRDVARTGIVALLGRRRRSHQNQWNNENKPGHLVVPSLKFEPRRLASASASTRSGSQRFLCRKSIGWSERPPGGQRSLGRVESSNPGSNGHPDRDQPNPRFVCETAAALAGR